MADTFFILADNDVWRKYLNASVHNVYIPSEEGNENFAINFKELIISLHCPDDE